MRLLHRKLKEKIEKYFFKGKIIIIYGARQVGKTTLVRQILENYKNSGRYLNCELNSVQEGLKDMEVDRLSAFLGNYKIIILDEAQNITNIGRKLKILIDTFPTIQIIATGSSSFDLADKTSEPLTGRSYKHILYPLSISEIINEFDQFTLESKFEHFLQFGLYPEVFFLNDEEAKERLNELSSDYLYKDILKFEGIRKSSVLKKLLQLISLQLGNEISLQELATSLGINRLTIQKYIDILEQAFVIFTLNAFSRNKRKEISKSFKIYFYDIGIRNSLIQNYNPVHLRNDIGGIWENFCILERKKNLSLTSKFVNSYFWRTYTQKEIDYIEEYDGNLYGYEFKWSTDRNYKPPMDFIKMYNSQVKRISKDNYLDFIEL